MPVSYTSWMLSTQQFIAGGSNDGMESQSVYQSAVVFRQYQCVDDGLSSLPRGETAVPGTMIIGENAALLLLGISSKSKR